MADKLEEADKLYKKASKLCQPSVMSWRLKADWEQACPMFERAGLLYKQSKKLDQAKLAYEKAATGQERQHSPWHAAKHLETSVDLCRETSDFSSIPDLARRAANLYAEAGRGQAAGEALAKAARAIEDSDGQTASSLYLEAVEILEEDGKEAMAGDIFRQAIANHIKGQRYADATIMLMRFALALEKSGAKNSQCKTYLSAVVVWLYAGNVKEAWATYQSALEIDVFTTSDEAFAAEALFDAYKSGVAAQVKEAVQKRPLFLSLDNQIAKLAKKLPTTDVSQAASALGGTAAPISTAGLDEEDLS